MNYDLIVIGNGLAAQTFLFELFNATKSQNFSVAQVYADEISPPCSLRSTATVALSGIEEGVSPLGNELRDAYFLFESFFKTHSPEGIEPVVQYILHSTEDEKEKLTRRYEKLSPVRSDLLKKEMTGIEMDSYQISPDVFKKWFEKKLNSFNLQRVKNFARNVEKDEFGHVVCTLLNGDVMKAKKLVLATGAYAKIFSPFFPAADMAPTQILSGSYLERTINLNRDSFFITLDGNKCVYRSREKQLVIGSVSQKGPFESGDFAGLKDLVALFKRHLAVEIGDIEDFKMVTGLRHKGRQRRPIYKALDAEKSLYMISGFYKNGFTFSHLAARTLTEDILKDLSL